MLSSLRVTVTNEQRLVWAELLQWIGLCFIFFVLLEIAMAVGIWIISAELRPFLLGHNADVLPSFLVVSGLLTIALSILGINGAWYSSSPNVDDRFYALKRMMWFEFLGIFLVVLDITLAITCFTIVHGDILWAAQRGLKSDMAKYNSVPMAKFKLDLLQTRYKCCGVESYRDWFGLPWQKYAARPSHDVEDSAPWSCCKPESARPCVHFLITQNRRQKAYTYPSDLTLHTEGCAEAITKYLGHRMLYICGGVLFVISFVLIAITQWMRILETALTNAYTLGDPEAQTWGYMLLNYGPDTQSMYEEVDQDDGGWGSDFDEEEPIYDEVAPFEETPIDTDVHALPIPGTGGAYYNSNNAASDSAYYIPAPPPLPDINDSLGLTPPPPLPFL